MRFYEPKFLFKFLLSPLPGSPLHCLRRLSQDSEMRAESGEELQPVPPLSSSSETGAAVMKASLILLLKVSVIAAGQVAAFFLTTPSTTRVPGLWNSSLVLYAGVLPVNSIYLIQMSSSSQVTTRVPQSSPVFRSSRLSTLVRMAGCTC